MSNRLIARPKIPTKLGSLLKPARYKGIHGGRGGGKSHFFAQLMVIRAAGEPGLRCLCIRETQRSLKESAKKLIEDKIESLGLGSLFEIQKDQIKAPGGGMIIFEGMQNHTAESIKSFEAVDIVWVEEGQQFSSVSLELLRPTIRKPGSELWFSWNPKDDDNAVDKLLRSSTPPKNSVVVQINHHENPWFTQELEDERALDEVNSPDRYDHIWLGDYEPAAPGSFWGSAIAEIDRNSQICAVDYTKDLPVHTAWDIGRTDDTAIWFYQWHWGEIRVIDYYANHGQETDHYVAVTAEKGYKYGTHWLPHDAFRITMGQGGRSVAKQLKGDKSKEIAGLQGNIRKTPHHRVQDGIQAARDTFKICWFDKDKTAKGMKALRAYRRQYDPIKDVFGKTPLHNWASHAGDAWRYLVQSYKHRDKPEEPTDTEMRGIADATFNEAMKLWDDVPSYEGRI